MCNPSTVPDWPRDLDIVIIVDIMSRHLFDVHQYQDTFNQELEYLQSISKTLTKNRTLYEKQRNGNLHCKKCPYVALKKGRGGEVTARYMMGVHLKASGIN